MRRLRHRLSLLFVCVFSFGLVKASCAQLGEPRSDVFTSAVSSALREGGIEPLKPIWPAADDYVFHAKLGGTSGESAFESPARTVQERANAWIDQTERCIRSSLSGVREYGQKQGIDWNTAIIRPALPPGDLVVRSGNKSIVVCVPKLEQNNRLFLSGEWVATTMSEAELKDFTRWSPGLNADIDRRIGTVALRNEVALGLWQYCIRGTQPRVVYTSQYLETPVGLDEQHADRVIWGPERTVLTETGDNTLVFEGSRRLPLFDRDFAITVRLVIDRQDLDRIRRAENVVLHAVLFHLDEQERWVREANQPYRFWPVAGKPGCFACPSLEELETNNGTRIVFSSGSVSEVWIEGRPLELPSPSTRER